MTLMMPPAASAAATRSRAQQRAARAMLFERDDAIKRCYAFITRCDAGGAPWRAIARERSARVARAARRGTRFARNIRAYATP